MKSRALVWGAAWLLALSSVAAQTHSNSPAPASPARPAAAPAPVASFSAFQTIPDRNIFNARRAPGRTIEEVPPPVRRERVIETFSLLGTLNNEKGPVAFFESSNPSYPKSAKVEESIAGCKITGIEQNVIRLDANGQALELRVGYQMRREDNGPWQMFEADRPSDYGTSYTPPPTLSLGSLRLGSSSITGRTLSPSGESPAESAQRRIREQDRNGDGKISLEEADSRLKPRFQLMDKNGDGFVDLAEYTAYYAERNGGGSSRTTFGSTGMTNNFTLPPGGSSLPLTASPASPGGINSPPFSTPSTPPPASSGGSSESDVLRRLLEQRARENR